MIDILPVLLVCALVGAVAGMLAGLLGIGGGLVIVPALAVLFGFPIKTAIGTSLLALLLPTGLLGVIEYWKTGNLRPVAGFCIALGLFFGAYVGARFAGTINQASVKRLYAVFLIIVAAYFLISPTRPTGNRAVDGAAPPSAPEASGTVPGPDQTVH